MPEETRRSNGVKGVRIVETVTLFVLWKSQKKKSSGGF